MNELKPCPFCGKIGAVKKYSDEKYKVCCSNHICPVESFKFNTKKEAIDWWNRRAPTYSVKHFCKTCKYNTANITRDPLSLEDYSDIVCSYWMSDGIDETKDFCSRYETAEQAVKERVQG